MTIGYEGIDLDRFFCLLQAGGVDTIMDVRQNPFSRKKGFSKNALATAACERGFGYVHRPEFGCPRTIRDDYRRDGDWAHYTARFLSHLDTLDAPILLLARQALTSRCCLLCFEADPALCHRSFVAARVSETADAPLNVIHLGVTDRVPTA